MIELKRFRLAWNKLNPRQLPLTKLYMPIQTAPAQATNCPGLPYIPRNSLLPTDERRIEKYRPIFLDDIVGNSETVERLKIIAKDGNMPHVIISGMPGIGKTTSILCLARQLLGPAYKEAVLELNASDERGWADHF